MGKNAPQSEVTRQPAWKSLPWIDICQSRYFVQDLRGSSHTLEPSSMGHKMLVLTTGWDTSSYLNTLGCPDHRLYWICKDPRIQATADGFDSECTWGVRAFRMPCQGCTLHASDMWRNSQHLWPNHPLSDGWLPECHFSYHLLSNRDFLNRLVPEWIFCWLVTLTLLTGRLLFKQLTIISVTSHQRNRTSTRYSYLDVYVITTVTAVTA